MTWTWPLKDCQPLLPDEPGSFGTVRSHDVHTGIDLYCEVGTEVVAVEDGEVISIEGFTGPHADDPSPWWKDTKAVLVRGASGIVVYGEIDPVVEVGQKLKAGGKVGSVLCVLVEYKGRPMTMLHVELLKDSSTETAWWKKGEPRLANLWKPGMMRPDCLLDPENKLERAAFRVLGRMPPHFNMETYDPKLYRGDAIQSGIAVVLRGCRVLMLRRSMKDPSYPGCWCFPGGRCKVPPLDQPELAPETPSEAALRELGEETGLTESSIIQGLGMQPSMDQQGRIYHVHAFEVLAVGVLRTTPAIRLTGEHDEHCWVPYEMCGLVTKNLLTGLLTVLGGGKK